MFWEVGLLVTTLAAAISASIGDEPPQGGSGIDATGAIINKSDPFGGLDANGVIINEAELLKISDEDIDFYNANSIEERKGCSPTNSCTRAGGYCIKGRARCTGTVDKDGCKGGKKCKCCIPDETTPPPVTCPPVTPCPTATDPCLSVGGKRISSQCLIFSSDYKSWHEARTTCQGRGQRLAVPRDPVAFDAYARSNHDGIFYLGASDINKEGTWTWINGQSLGSSFPWGPNEPNDNNGNEDCLEWGRSPNRVYNDGVCTTVIRYICELDETTPPPVTCPPVTPCPTAPGICPSPFRLRGNECLFIPEYLNETLNWDESRQKCLSMGGDLAQPQDMVDFVNFLEESYPGFKPSTVWLGATDREVEQEWKWLSGESVPPAMWEPWIGNQPSGDGNCMEIHKWPYTEFFMNDWYCHNKGYFACEIDETTPPPVTCPDITPCPTTQGCPEGLLSLLGTHKCVKVFDDVDRNWYEAHLKCRKEGLTMVKTSNENALNIRQALVNLLGDAGSYAWLDAEFNGVQYVWGDGEVIANDNSLWYTPYINLKPGYCMGLLNSQTFIDRSPSTVYYGTLCNAIAHGRKAFCEYDNCPANCYHGSCNNGVCYCQPGYTGPKCSGKDTGDGCPLDAGFFWLSSSSQCFKLMLDHGNLNWEEGKAVCESNNLKLAHPYDAIGLRSYLAQRYGNYAAFLNARDNGAGAITWLDSGEIIKTDHPLWRTGAPYSLSNACLIIQGLDAEINQPFWATQCQWRYSTRYPLCELE